jgi:hypothetical protein
LTGELFDYQISLLELTFFKQKCSIMHKQAKTTKSSREMNSCSAEISTSTSADPDPDNQQRPSPSVGETRPDRPRRLKQKKSKTPEEIGEKASSKRLLRNREAAVEHVLTEDEKNKPRKRSSRRGVVRVNDSEGQLNDITMILKEDDLLLKENIPGAVSLVRSSSKDDPKKQDEDDEVKKDATLLVNLASVDGAKMLSSMENGQLHAGAEPNVVDGEPVPLPPS